jgi:hypothetical protein
MRIIKSKKSSLNISINAIVIIVLAMTFLGLGLGFVRNMFSDIGGTTTQVQEQIKQQILDDLRTGDKKLSFPTTQVKVGSKEETIISIGVKNTGDTTLYFEIDIFEDEDEAEPSTSAADTDVNGAFFWDDSEQQLDPGESNVFGIKYFAPTPKSTYLFKLKITDVSPDADTDVYSTKSFFIRVI